MVLELDMLDPLETVDRTMAGQICSVDATCRVIMQTGQQ